MLCDPLPPLFSSSSILLSLDLRAASHKPRRCLHLIQLDNLAVDFAHLARLDDTLYAFFK